MAWFFIAATLILLWVVSLCKILYASTPKVAFLSEGEAVRKRTVLLVVAHPDDESMFFSPTILYLTSAGHNVHILCLSTGNADGKGDTRREELYQACAALKMNACRCVTYYVVFCEMRGEARALSPRLSTPSRRLGVA
ncbi:N-acetylglucosaminyl phosphatidylinositol deacetylase [Macleaya cordata]|uniref:N-acetylglucosaminylphosphatidylinositol deacetylase n=1 Tax=Macleaya cordata TaxID=56857 RepID=A0A200RA16_MACCD|nr:N-acetylglucosaminyl phosphatidylinositol deacetylase [Macleaya cordata]